MPSIDAVLWRISVVFDRDDVAGLSYVAEMQLNPTCFKLLQHILNSPLD